MARWRTTSPTFLRRQRKVQYLPPGRVPAVLVPAVAYVAVSRVLGSAHAAVNSAAGGGGGGPQQADGGGVG
eukprot:202456-Prymnesium_polylepis.1